MTNYTHHKLGAITMIGGKDWREIEGEREEESFIGILRQVITISTYKQVIHEKIIYNKFMNISVRLLIVKL